jgi:beta-phosphoglucomutase-like phosphatase (HAD superfamily)
VDWAVLSFLDSRYRASFSSPDVRPFFRADDVVLDSEESLREISRVAEGNGSYCFGKYGYLLEREGLEKAATLEKEKERLLNSLSKTSAFFLDFDGTIADTESIHFRAYKTLLNREFGKSIDKKFFSKLIGQPRDNAYRIIKNSLSLSFDNDDFESKRLEVFTEIQTRRKLEPNDIIIDILDKYRNKPAVIVSTQKKELIERLLRSWNIENRFDAIYSTDDKEKTLRTLVKKYSTGSQSVALFEDVNENIVAGKNLGFFCIGVENGFNRRKLKDADILIREELLTVS